MDCQSLVLCFSQLVAKAGDEVLLKPPSGNLASSFRSSSQTGGEPVLRDHHSWHWWRRVAWRDDDRVQSGYVYFFALNILYLYVVVNEYKYSLMCGTECIKILFFSFVSVFIGHQSYELLMIFRSNKPSVVHCTETAISGMFQTQQSFWECNTGNKGQMGIKIVRMLGLVSIISVSPVCDMIRGCLHQMHPRFQTSQTDQSDHIF